MWEWGRLSAEYATAASWISWQAVRTEPTILDPETWVEEEIDDDVDGMRISAPEFDLVG